MKTTIHEFNLNRSNNYSVRPTVLLRTRFSEGNARSSRAMCARRRGLDGPTLPRVVKESRLSVAVPVGVVAIAMDVAVFVHVTRVHGLSHVGELQATSGLQVVTNFFLSKENDYDLNVVKSKMK